MTSDHADEDLMTRRQVANPYGVVRDWGWGVLAWRAGWRVVTVRRRGRRPGRRWPGRFRRSIRGVRGSAAGSAIAWARRWRARRRSARRTAGCVLLPRRRFLPAAASFFGFSGGALTWPGKSRARPRYPASTSALTWGYWRSRSSMPSVRSAVWSCMRPGRNAPAHSSPSLAVADDGGLVGVLLLLAGHERPAAGLARAGAPDLHLGAVDPQVDALGGGVGEHVGQRAQPQPGLAGHGEPAGGQQRPDLAHGAGDGGAVHPVKHRQRGVRELEPQDDQGGDDPVGERQLVVRARALGAQPRSCPRRPRSRDSCGATTGPASSAISLPSGGGGGRCRYDATRPRGPILTTHLDRSARPLTFPGPTRQDQPLRPGSPIAHQVVTSTTSRLLAKSRSATQSSIRAVEAECLKMQRLKSASRVVRASLVEIWPESRFVSALWPGAVRMPALLARTMAVIQRRRSRRAVGAGRSRPG